MTDQIDSIEISELSALPTNPLVSVYMLTYKHETFIADAIEGVIAQRCNFPIELIIGEDCSPDRTGAIVRGYQKRYPHLIRILTATRNIGTRLNSKRCTLACRGKYITICEGDDYWTDIDKLSIQVRIMESDPKVTLVCHAVNEVSGTTGALVGSHRCARKSRNLSTFEVITGDGSFIATCSIMARRSLYESRPVWWEEAPIGDYPLVLRATQLGKITYLDRLMGVYRVNVPGSWTQTHVDLACVEDRYAHAVAMKRLLFGYESDTGNHYAVRQVVRKYLFNAIVQSSGETNVKRQFLRAEASCLTAYDRFLARFALWSGLRLTKLRMYPSAIYRWSFALMRDVAWQRSVH